MYEQRNLQKHQKLGRHATKKPLRWKLWRKLKFQHVQSYFSQSAKFIIFMSASLTSPTRMKRTYERAVASSMPGAMQTLGWFIRKYQTWHTLDKWQSLFFQLLLTKKQPRAHIHEQQHYLKVFAAYRRSAQCSDHTTQWLPPLLLGWFDQLRRWGSQNRSDATLSRSWKYDKQEKQTRIKRRVVLQI